MVMSTRVQAKPAVRRRAPRQARSRATVEAIITAGAHVLGRLGWQGFTTNHVAEVAGVSIGSLYQYFPDKFSLIEAIRQKHFDEVLGVLRALTSGRVSLKKRIEQLVDGMFAVHASQPALHRALLEDAPLRAESQSADAAFLAEYLGLYTSFIASVNKGEKPGRNEIIARTLAAAIEGAVHDAARQGEMEAIARKQELVHLVYAYLRTCSSIQA